MKIRIFLLLLAFSGVLRADDLQRRIETLAKKSEAVVGVAAEDTITGRRVSIRADEAFPMGSVYKFPIVLSVLHRTQDRVSLDTDVTTEPSDFSPGHSPMIENADGKSITNPLGTVIVYALRDSDNTASDALLRFIGGPRGVMAYLTFLGVRGIDVSRSEKQIAADIKSRGQESYWKDPRDTATPNAMLLLFRMYDQKAHGLTDGGQRFVQDMMLHTDGGKNRIRAGAPPGATVLEKSGTMPGVVNDAGLIATADGTHRIIVVVFTKGWRKTADAKREKLIADITREVVEEFSK